jgi:hypothetical protein
MEVSNQRITIPKPFHYEVMWERHEGYKEVLDNVRSERKADSVVDLSDKLRSTTGSFAKWGSTSFGAVRKELREIRKKLVSLRAELQRVGPSYEERKVDGQIEELCYREEIMCRQRAWVQWLLEGDRNTHFSSQS